MSRLTTPRLSFRLWLLTLGLAACDDPPAYSSAEDIAAVAVSGSGVTVDVVTTDVWNTGFNGAVRIINTAFASPITSFEIVFRLGGDAAIVGPPWNGNISPPDAAGNRTATHPDWLPHNPLRTGGTWDVGFPGGGAFAGSTIVSVKLNGQTIPIGGGGGGDTTDPVVSLASSATTVTAAGNITLTATATDNIGVTRVEFFDGSTLLGTDTSSPYTQAVALTAAHNGTRIYRAIAFDAAGNDGTVTVSVTVNIPGQSTGAVFRVNAQGRITKNGQIFPVRCGSWFGLEGRHEPSSDPSNPSGAPMELYIGNTFWANGGAGTGRTIQQTMTEITARGINVVRLPVVPQTLDPDDPQGRAPFLKNHPTVQIANSRLALEQFIRLADQNNIEVMLDLHSCSNFVGWRKGRLDARPPWADHDRDNYDFKRENYSCAATDNPSTVTTVHPYNETLWLNDLRTLAGLGQQLGVDNIIGIDIYNEPHDYTWAEWKRLTEAAYQAINAVNPDTLLFVQGISATANGQDGTPDTTTAVPHGEVFTNPNWGENLFEAGANPPSMPKERLVYSPHTYGPSVFVQRMFMDPAQPRCTGLEGDAAGDADCNIVINPTLLRRGWEEHFGYTSASSGAASTTPPGSRGTWVNGESSPTVGQPCGHAGGRQRDRGTEGREDQVTGRPSQPAHRRGQHGLGARLLFLGAQPERGLYSVPGGHQAEDSEARGEVRVHDPDLAAERRDQHPDSRAAAQQIRDAWRDPAERGADHRECDRPAEQRTPLQAPREPEGAAEPARCRGGARAGRYDPGAEIAARGQRVGGGGEGGGDCRGEGTDPPPLAGERTDAL